MSFKVTRLHDNIPVEPKVLLSQLMDMDDIADMVVIVKTKKGIFSTHWTDVCVGDMSFMAKILDTEITEIILNDARTDSTDGDQDKTS